jgi:hypothetical protein
MSFSLIPQINAAPKYPGDMWGRGLNDCAVDGVATITGIQCLIANILDPLPSLIALAAVGMIIWAGARMIGAGSDQKAYAAAWQTFTYAIVGLILLSVVWLALILIEKFTGAPVTQFGI